MSNKKPTPEAPSSKAVAPLATVTDEMAKKLQETCRLIGKKIGGHLCIVMTPR